MSTIVHRFVSDDDPLEIHAQDDKRRQIGQVRLTTQGLAFRPSGHAYYRLIKWGALWDLFNEHGEWD